MAGTEQRVSDLEAEVGVLEATLAVTDARLNEARVRTVVLAAFAKSAGVRIAALEEKSHEHDEPGKAL